MSREVNRDEIERRRSRLEDEWGSFPITTWEETLPPAEFAESKELVRSGYTGGGYVWAVREPDEAAPLTESMPDDAEEDGRRVLLGMGRGVDRWGPPGGGREGDETYEDAAVREVREETTVDVTVTDVAHGYRWITRPEDGSERVDTLFVVFEGAYEDGHIEIQPGELNGAAWFRSLPDRLHPFAEPLAEAWNEPEEPLDDPLPDELDEDDE